MKKLYRLKPFTQQSRPLLTPRSTMDTELELINYSVSTHVMSEPKKKKNPATPTVFPPPVFSEDLPLTAASTDH